jgi:hypothetical protein
MRNTNTVDELENVIHKTMDKIILLEQAYYGPRLYWLNRGISLGSSIMLFALWPKYRLITGTIAAANIVSTIVGVAVVKYAEENAKKNHENVLKKYPNIVSDLLNKVQENKDVH